MLRHFIKIRNPQLPLNQGVMIQAAIAALRDMRPPLLMNRMESLLKAAVQTVKALFEVSVIRLNVMAPQALLEFNASTIFGKAC